MSEAISYYARTKEEKSEDSGVESGNSLENTGDDISSSGMNILMIFLVLGSDSQAESSSEHSGQEEINSGERGTIIEEKENEEMLVSRL